MSILNSIITGSSSDWEVSTCTSYANSEWKFTVTHEPSKWFMFFNGSGYISSSTNCLTWAGDVGELLGWRCTIYYGSSSTGRGRIGTPTSNVSTSYTGTSFYVNVASAYMVGNNAESYILIYA